jgi:hypothetical protein
MDILQGEISALPFVTLFDKFPVESELIRVCAGEIDQRPHTDILSAAQRQ